MNIVLFVPRDPSGKQDGMLLCIVANEGDEVFYLVKLQSTCLVFPCTLVVRPDAKKLAFRAMK